MPQANNVFVYDTNALIQVVPNLKLSQQFLLDRFFGNVVMSDTEYVSIDVDIGKRRMSPFVSPLVEGKLVEQRRYQTNQFKPAYVKDKRAPDLRKPVRRAIGEQIGGAMTGAEREAANLEAELTDQLDMLNRRLEWMAASALMFGTVTIVGDGFPSVVVDFGRDSSLTVAKSGYWQVDGGKHRCWHCVAVERHRKLGAAGPEEIRCRGERSRVQHERLAGLQAGPRARRRDHLSEILG